MTDPVRTLVICATPRSGSYLLCEALRLTGRAGHPEEYLWRPNAERFADEWGTDVDVDYGGALAKHATDESGTLATKVMWGYAATAARVLAGRPWGAPDDSGDHRDIELLAGVRDARFVFMSRADTAAQAVSYSKAVKADAWARLADGSDVPGAMPVLDDRVRRTKRANVIDVRDYEFDHVRYFYEEIRNHNAGWRQFFDDHDIEPLEVSYERLVAEYEQVATEIVDALGTREGSLTFGERRMQKQRDSVSRRWLLRFREDQLAHEIRTRWTTTRGLELRSDESTK